ncbi:MAG TPA: MauE/DoxX family redox-associated membrane protein, partial [Chitinophagaceae bacterium]|nr:MauE/DoxX family redox-associated membrane protein [Chitinophagaceae bacterium]
MKRTTIVDIITILTLSLFLYATIAKIMDYTLFKEQLAESPVLKPVAVPLAIGLPIVEIVLVVLLAIPRWRL